MSIDKGGKDLFNIHDLGCTAVRELVTLIDFSRPVKVGKIDGLFMMRVRQSLVAINTLCA